MNPKRKPKFLRQGAKYQKKVGQKWRKPRGRDSKLKKNHKGKGSMPNIGFGAPKDLKYKHPSGFYEVLVSNINELSDIDSKNQSVRISGSVGKRKKQLIFKKAEELKIKILNP